MHRIGAVAIVLLLALWAGVILAQNESATPVPYVYRLKISGCTFDPVDRRQTGFRVQGMAGIVTAMHGVADCQSITAVPDDGIPFTDLVITAVDIERDIALLSSPALVDHPFDGLVPSTLTAHEMLTATLRVVGYPLGLDKQDADLIESVRAVESLDAVIPDPEEPPDFLKRRSPDINIDVLNLQAQLLPGHSGAPVIDQANQIIAVGNGGLRGGTVGRSWAIPWQSVQLASVEEAEVTEKLATLAAKNITALSFSSTYPSSPETTGTPATYMVRVVGMNQQPIANAEILLTHSAGYEIGLTDSEGFYTFHLPTNVSYVQSQIQVEAPGYPLYNRTLSNVLGKVGTEVVRLTALRPTPSPVASGFCEFAFRILDEASQQPIENANLAVTLGSRLATGKTDSNGFYESKLSCPDPPNASVRLRIMADGYGQHSETVPLVGEIKEIFLTQMSLPTLTLSPTPPPTLTQPSISSPTDHGFEQVIGKVTYKLVEVKQEGNGIKAWVVAKNEGVSTQSAICSYANGNVGFCRLLDDVGNSYDGNYNGWVWTSVILPSNAPFRFEVSFPARGLTSISLLEIPVSGGLIEFHSVPIPYTATESSVEPPALEITNQEFEQEIGRVTYKLVEVKQESGGIKVSMVAKNEGVNVQSAICSYANGNVGFCRFFDDAGNSYDGAFNGRIWNYTTLPSSTPFRFEISFPARGVTNMSVLEIPVSGGLMEFHNVPIPYKAPE